MIRLRLLGGWLLDLELDTAETEDDDEPPRPALIGFGCITERDIDEE